jgi:hypothetical protein
VPQIGKRVIEDDRTNIVIEVTFGCPTDSDPEVCRCYGVTFTNPYPRCTENLVRVDDLMESLKLAE